MGKQHQAIARWRELADGCLEDVPPKRKDGFFVVVLFVNHCEVRRGKSRDFVIRKLGVEEIAASSREELDQKVLEFVEQDDVRLLVPGLESNNFRRLPQREPATSAIIDGSADVYREKCVAHST